MAEKSIIKKYKKDDFTILWEPKKCIHSAICVKELPQVYDPKAKPWIKPENATIDQLKEQIQACPSGALSYRMEGEQEGEQAHLDTKVEVLENGPLLVYGTLNITKSNGETEVKNKTTAFCRCGASANKPYCDGAHVGTDFKG